MMRNGVVGQTPTRGVGTAMWFRGGGDGGGVGPAARLYLAHDGQEVAAKPSAPAGCVSAPFAPAATRLTGFPSFTPWAFFAARAALVRPAIRLRSFSARAAYRCSMKGSASAPSSATMKGTRRAIRPATKATSRDRRSSLATTTLHFAAFAAASAAASWGRLSKASAPFPGLASTYSPAIVRDSLAAKRSMVVR